MPGVPPTSSFAWLAGVIDRGGGFTVDPLGLKISGSMGLTGELYITFGGRLYNADDLSAGRSTWWQTRHADLGIILPRVHGHLNVRAAECEAIRDLLAHHDRRTTYHGDARWRARRDTLRAAVAAARC